MRALDIFIVIVYMAFVQYIGYVVGKTNKTEDDYFTAGRTMPWFAIGLSVGVTMISANTFIGGPGWGFKDGIIAAMVNITVPLSILFVTYTVVPVLYNSKVTTVYEYINVRLGDKSRLLNVGIWLCSSLILMGGFIFTPSLVLSKITNISFEAWVPIIVIFSIIYTVIGGIKAVIWTDALQAVVLFAGVVFAIIFAIYKLPAGAGEVMTIARESGKLISFDWLFNKDSLNVWCVMFGGFAMWIGYFGFDQGQVQRYFTSKNMANIKKAGVLSSIAMQLIYWGAIGLGVFLFIFYKSNAATLDFKNTNLIMTDFLLNYTPSGLLGLLLAATFAAAMSSIDSILNSLTTVFTKDIYEPYISKKQETPLSKTIMFTIVFGFIIMIFVYAGLNGSTKSILDTIAGYLSPFGALVTGTMITCIFIPRVNDNGAFIGTLIAALATFLTQKYMPMHWLWIYLIGAIYCIVLSYLCSLLFKDESNKIKQYTVQGVKEMLGNAADDEGVKLAPLVMDKYGWIIIGVFVVQCIILVALQ